MKKFIFQNSTYGIQSGILYKKTGNIWSYEYMPEKELRTVATINGYKGDIKDNLICKGFHTYARYN